MASEQGAQEPLRLMLVGLRGAGKSASGNTILGSKEFQSDISSISVTLKSESREGLVCERSVMVVDTPGVFNTDLSDQEMKHEIEKALTLCHPGPHIILIVIQLGRFTEQERRVTEELNEVLGPNVNLYSMVLFTYGDKLKNKTIDQFVKEDKNLLSLIEKCGGQYHVFNNTVPENKAQVRELLEKIDNQIKKTGKQPYFVKVNELQNPGKELRIVLLGKTGVGKSSSGNTILGDEAFKCDLSPSSVTKDCRKETKQVNGRKVSVIDTPGLYDPSFTLEETINRIKMCIFHSAPGPHVFLVVVELRRFTSEDINTIEAFLKIFGEDASRHTMILFTHGDELGKMSIHEFISKNVDLTSVTVKFKHRHHVLNNVVKDQGQVDQLLEKIDELVSDNGGEPYTNEMLLIAEQAIEEEKWRILKEDEERRGKLLEALKQEAMCEATKQLMERREKEAREQAEKNNKYIDVLTQLLWKLLENYIRKN